MHREQAHRAAQATDDVKSQLSLIVGSLDALDEYATALVRFVVACAACVRCDAQLAQLRHELNIEYVTDHTPELLDICRRGANQLGHLLDHLGSGASDVYGGVEPRHARER